VATLLSFTSMAISMARRLAKPPSTQASLFLTSCESRKAALSDHQRRTFANGDAKQALDAARRLNDDNRNDSRFRSSMGTINEWIVGIQRYFGVVDIFLSAKPDVAALIWGGIKFLIEVRSRTCSYDGNLSDAVSRQVVRQYNDFLDKLTSITEVMTRDLEIYQDYTILYSDSGGVQRVCFLLSLMKTEANQDVKTLSLVYEDILKLCTVVYKAFMTKKGKKRCRSHNILDHTRSLTTS
jgi:hypothetical protein